mmetsp:Transcript_8976/g.23129  ORF Transcript_8976/g.23129 Transcript_8976/m.23129 type:complete len:254 (-) Transcript_8976:273-1034(-)
MSCGSCSPCSKDRPADSAPAVGAEIGIGRLLRGPRGAWLLIGSSPCWTMALPPPSSSSTPSITAESSFVASLASWLRMVLTSCAPFRIIFITCLTPTLPVATPPSIDSSSAVLRSASACLSSPMADTVFCTLFQRLELDSALVAPSCSFSLRGLDDRLFRSMCPLNPGELRVRSSFSEIAASLSATRPAERIPGPMSTPLSTILLSISTLSGPASDLLLPVSPGPMSSTAWASCFSVCARCSWRLAASCEALL